METISEGHSNCLVGVEVMWVRDSGPFPSSSLRLLTNTLRDIELSSYIKSSTKRDHHVDFF